MLVVLLFWGFFFILFPYFHSSTWFPFFKSFSQRLGKTSCLHLSLSKKLLSVSLIIKKLEHRNLFMFFLIFLSDECRQQTIALLCRPSHACCNKYHTFAAGHKLLNFNPIRDISLHLFGRLFLIALHNQSHTNLLTNKIIYSSLY